MRQSERMLSHRPDGARPQSATVNPILISRSLRGKVALQPGQPGHDHQVVADRFTAMLDARGIDSCVIDAPDFGP